MKDIVLLLRQRKGIYLALLCITGILSVLEAVSLQKIESTLSDTYAVMLFLMFGVISIVALVTPKSEKEFFESLPVKKIAVELCPYVGFLGIFAIDILLAVIASKIAGGTKAGIAGLSPEEFVCLCMAMLAAGTLIYLCLGILKEPAWGVGMFVGIWFTIAEATGIYEIGRATLPVTVAGATRMLAVAVAVMVVLMVLHAYHRELSGGRLGFFRSVDVVVMSVFAVTIFSITYMVSDSVGWSVLTAVVAESYIYREVFYKKRALQKVEVRVDAQKKNPWFFYRLPAWLGAMGVMLLLVLGSGVRMHMESGFFGNEMLQVFVIGLLSIYGMLGYNKNSKKETREFFERLPVSRKKRYTTMVTMDILLAAIPLLCNTVRSFAVFCFAVGVIGILYLVDAVTVGELKMLNYSIVIMTISILMSMLENLFQSQSGQSTLLWMAIPCLVIGALLIVWAGLLYVRRENSREYFYYKPAMHVFAILYAAAFAFFVVSVTHSIVWYVIAAAGAVLIYCISVQMFSQPKKY